MVLIRRHAPRQAQDILTIQALRASPRVEVLLHHREHNRILLDQLLATQALGHSLLRQLPGRGALPGPGEGDRRRRRVGKQRGLDDMKIGCELHARSELPVGLPLADHDAPGRKGLGVARGVDGAGQLLRRRRRAEEVADEGVQRERVRDRGARGASCYARCATAVADGHRVAHALGRLLGDELVRPGLLDFELVC